MKFFYIDWECGSGKTDGLLKHIVANPGLYIVALNKIELFNEQMSRLKNLAGSISIQVNAIHSNDGIRKMAVAARINEQIQATNDANIKHCVLFITHEALWLVDWKRQDLQANKWSLFIDEAPAIWGFVKKNFEVSQTSILEYITTKAAGTGESEHKDYTRIQITDKGETLRRSKTDAMKPVVIDILNGITGARYGYANRSFFGIAQDGKKSTDLSLFSIADPEAFSEFKETTILAANFKETFAYQIWLLTGEKFLKHPKFVEPQKRDVPLKDRIRIHYFSEKDASLNWFHNQANPLAIASKWIDENITVKFYYSVNEYRKGGNKLDLITSGLAKRIQPIALGSDKLKDMTAAVWLVALKAQPPEYYTILELLGIDRDQYDRAREHEYLYQFALRSNLRDFQSSTVVDVYVVSERQAKILKSITGADQIHKVPIDLPAPVVVKDANAQPAGRPKIFSDEEAKDRKRERDRIRLRKKRAK